jgi:hypothetical protein
MSRCSLQLSISCSVIAVIVLLYFGGAAAQDNSGTIELGMETESGLQINYEISGATITKVGEDNRDFNGLSNERVLEGVLDSDQLRISGVATYKSFKDRSDSDLVVKVVDDSEQVVGKPYTDNTKGSGEMKFDLVVPVSKDKTYHFEIVETGYMNYNHKVKVSGTLHPAAQGYLNLPPDTRSSKTFDPRSLKPLAGLHLEHLNGDVYVMRGNEKISAKKGFQFREGDIVEVSVESDAYIISETGLSFSLFSFGTSKAVIPTNEDLIEIEQRIKKVKQEREELDPMIVSARIQMLIVLEQPEKSVKKSLPNSMKPSLRVEMNYCKAEDVHTKFVCLQTSDASIILVLDGTVKFTSSVTGEEILVNASEMATATATGLSPLESFDVEAEKAIWDKYISTTESSPVILASTWTVSERGPQGDYYGTWTRRPGTDTFDASWSGGSITDVIDITSVEGNKVTLHRHGNNGDYTGTISPDGKSISGTASWYVPEERWLVSI